MGVSGLNAYKLGLLFDLEVTEARMESDRLASSQALVQHLLYV